MGLMDFFEKRRQGKSFQRQLKAKEKLEKLESRAFTFEREAELVSGIKKQKEKIRKSKRKIFESSPVFAAIEKMQSGARQFHQFQQGSAGPRRKKGKTKKQKGKVKFHERIRREEEIFGGSDSF